MGIETGLLRLFRQAEMDAQSAAGDARSSLSSPCSNVDL
jgi:hypothetical protein